MNDIKIKKYRIRSKKVNSDELDDVLLNLQNENKRIANVLPCPESVDLKYVEDTDKRQIPTTDYHMKMSFIVLYDELVEE